MSQESPARFMGPNHLRALPEDVPTTQDDERADLELPDVTGRNLSAALNKADVVIRGKEVMKIKSLVILCFALACSAAASRELHSYALIQDDGSLLIEGKRVHLYGVRLPDSLTL